MNLKKYDIQSQGNITSWDEALPLGNGKLGCLIYGDGPLRFSVDRVDLWDERINPTTLEKGFCFQNIVKTVKDGSKEAWAEARRLFDNILIDCAYPTKITAGRIELDFGEKINTTSHLSLQTAIADVSFGDKGKAQAFMSATRFVGVAKIFGDFSVNIHIPTYISGDENGECANNSGVGEAEWASCLGYPRAEIIKDGDFTYYEQTTFTDFSYGIVVYRKQVGDCAELYFTIATNADAKDYIALAKKELLSVAEMGYENVKKEHIAWWKRYWAKSQISIGDELLEKTYYRSWYLFASCSRKGFYPMPLQGVWTADNDSLPPWKGDYHHDTNTELSYQSYLKANRLDEGRVFVDYLWNMRAKYRSFAKSFYGVNGLLLPSSSSLNGVAMGGWMQYSFSPTMTIWAAQSFDEYYLYTGDEKFLKTRAYPFLKEVGKAIYALLEEKDGKLYLPVSSSPEIFDDTPQAYLKPNSNFDLALLRWLYKTLDGYARKLGESGAHYAEILSKLDGFAIKDGVGLLLDKDTQLQESHRHFSHLMCLYPLHLINYDSTENQRVYEASLLELERLGMGMWVGFSYAMCAQIYAMAYKGNAAYEKLRQFCHGFVAENGFHLNGDFKNYGYSTFHYRPFTLESSFGFCDALQEMLLQEHQGYVHLFPAIPKEWDSREISFKNLRSYGGVLLSAARKNLRVNRAEAWTAAPREISFKNVFGTEQVCVETPNGEKYIAKEKDGFFVVSLEKGRTKITIL